jgi:hypothetical protein
VLSNDFAVVGHLAGGEAWEHAVMWVGSTPVILGTEAEVVSAARIHWWGM